MPYKHSTGTVIQEYNSHEEHCFYEKTTKREMFLLIEQLSKLNAPGEKDWTKYAKEQIRINKINGIK